MDVAPSLNGSAHAQAPPMVLAEVLMRYADELDAIAIMAAKIDDAIGAGAGLGRRASDTTALQQADLMRQMVEDAARVARLMAHKVEAGTPLHARELREALRLRGMYTRLTSGPGMAQDEVPDSGEVALF